MPDLLLELLSEEIPARMQRRAAEDLRKLVTGALVEAGFVYEGAKAFAAPRRLALTVSGIPARSPDTREERKGPRVGASESALAGFLKAASLASIREAKVQTDPKKGDFYVALIEKPGIAAEAMLAEALPRIVREFPWPKSMRWGAASAAPGGLRWVRPLHAIVATFGPETEDVVVIPFAVDGIVAGDTTFGHRYMAPDPIKVRRFDDYVDALREAKVVLDADRRKDIILHDARDRAFALGLELIEDDGLLEEVAGLAEWPVVLVGSFDAAFLTIPPEAIRATIRANQKCFVLRRPTVGGNSPLPAGERPSGRDSSRMGEGGPTGVEAPSPVSRSDDRGTTSPPGGEVTGSSSASDAIPLANRFVMVANIEASDGGKAIVAGNERVIRARLSDARHFWETDRRDLPDYDTPAMRAAAARLGLDLSKPLDQRMAKLAATNVVFHEKLGTQGERVERLVRLSGEIADVLSARPDFFAGQRLNAEELRGEQQAFRRKVERAAALAKADLVTEMVGEFPELQGLMGRYYAAAQGEDPSVAAALEDHYKPQGPGDRVPTDPVAIVVALAEKLDILVGFWAIDEKPTGSKDPYALRRAALGVIRIVLDSGLRVRLDEVFKTILLTYLLHGFHPPGSYLSGGYAGLVGARDVAGGASSRNWLEGRYMIYVNYDGLFDQPKQELASQAEFVVDWEGNEGEAYDALHDLGMRLGALDMIVESQHQFFDVAGHDKERWRGASRVLGPQLLAFFADRLKVQLREQGARHDLVDAVFALGHPSAVHPPLDGEEPAPDLIRGRAPRVRPLAGPRAGSGAGRGDIAGVAGTPTRSAPPTDLPRRGGGGQGTPATGVQDDLVLIVRRVEALGGFLDSAEGKQLLAGYRRATNILRDEEKKSGAAFAAEADAKLLAEPEEKALHRAIGEAENAARAAIAMEDFAAAMSALAKLQAPVDAFFEKVLVNAPDPAVRTNRLRLLNRIREATLTVADFSKVEG